MRHTENQSFRYSAFPRCVLKGFVERATRLYEQEPEAAFASARLGLYVRRWVRWARGARRGPDCTRAAALPRSSLSSGAPQADIAAIASALAANSTRRASRR